MTEKKKSEYIEADSATCPIIDMLGFDPRELNMLRFELDDDETTSLNPKDDG